MDWEGSFDYLSGSPLTYSDWIFEDETGCIYVSAHSVWPDLDPYDDNGTPLRIIARVTSTLDDGFTSNDDCFQPYLECERIL
jgi:hypothetical protein